MSEITLKGGEQIPPKRKKKNVAGKIVAAILIVVIGLPVLLVGAVFACFYDPTHTKIKTRDEYPNNEVINDVVVHSLDNTISTHAMRVRLTEDALNQLFHNVLYKDGKKIDVLDNLYVQIDDNYYVFGIEVNLYEFFKTRVILKTKLSVNDDGISFKVSNIQLGRISGLDNVAKLILEHINLPDINKILSDHGLHMTFDLKKLEINYPYDAFFEDLEAALPEDVDKYTKLLFEVIRNQEITTLIPNSEKALELKIDIDKMRPNELYNIENYIVPSGYLDNYFGNAKTKVKEYLQSEIIDIKDTSTVARYYVSGYDVLSDEQKTVIDGYLTSSNPIYPCGDDVYKYQIPDNENLAYILGEQLSTYPAGADYYEAEFTTDQIDRALSQASAIGEIMTFTSKEVDETYTVNHIGINRVSCVIDPTDDSFYLSFSVSFNGYDAVLSLKTVMDVSISQYGVTKFTVEGLYIGDYRLSEESQAYFMDMIKDAVADGAFDETVQIVVEGDQLYLTITLAALLAEHNITEEEGYTTEYGFVAHTATTPGHIIFKARKN